MYVKSYTYGILGGLLSGLCTQTLAQKTPKLNFDIAILDEPPRTELIRIIPNSGRPPPFNAGRLYWKLTGPQLPGASAEHTPSSIEGGPLGGKPGNSKYI